MPVPSRRLSKRRPLTPPLEAELLLCDEIVVSGWIVDEQDDGFGLAFGASDVDRLEAHRTCCIGGPVDLRIIAPDHGPRPIPVHLIHVTEHGSGHACRVGLSFDISRMKAADITHLLSVWRTVLAPGARPPTV